MSICHAIWCIVLLLCRKVTFSLSWYAFTRCSALSPQYFFFFLAETCTNLDLLSNFQSVKKWNCMKHSHFNFADVDIFVNILNWPNTKVRNKMVRTILLCFYYSFQGFNFDLILLNFVAMDEYSLFYVLQVHEIISSFDFFKDWKFRKYLVKLHGYKNWNATSKSVRPYGAESNLC